MQPETRSGDGTTPGRGNTFSPLFLGSALFSAGREDRRAGTLAILARVRARNRTDASFDTSFSNNVLGDFERTLRSSGAIRPSMRSLRTRIRGSLPPKAKSRRGPFTEFSITRRRPAIHGRPNSVNRAGRVRTASLSGMQASWFEFRRPENAGALYVDPSLATTSPDVALSWIRRATPSRGCTACRIPVSPTGPPGRVAGALRAGQEEQQNSPWRDRYPMRGSRRFARWPCSFRQASMRNQHQTHHALQECGRVTPASILAVDRMVRDPEKPAIPLCMRPSFRRTRVTSTIDQALRTNPRSPIQLKLDYRRMIYHKKLGF